ncbi:protein HEXIM1 [Myripristis murdjan]|uniref:protein HEXIM1 n=1 Tax=Myripristis murdjan TaxID=586833 RepID=UPI001175D65B|nr:protein HEXIM1 [Myripristis murdjan]
MTEPSTEQTHHLKTSDTPSGGTGAVLEHLPASDHAPPENGDRGRQRDKQQQQAENGGRDINTDKLWQMQGGQREVCPALAAGNALPKCPVAAQPRQEPGVDASGEGNLAAHGNSGDGPLEETLSQVQGESCVHNLHIDSDTGTDARQGKKKHRRRPSKKKRRWKPYFKLSWEEKKALDERETARASRVREEMFAKGLPVAPYNTTQFLMDEHDREEPDLNTETGVRRLAGPGGVGFGGRMDDTGSEEDFFDNEEEEEEDGSGGGSDGIGRPGNAGGEFLQRDFSETYEKYHVETLQNMTKQELVQEYLELEKCMSRLEEENNRLRRAMEPGGLSEESPLVRLRELELELERLRAQNTELRLQNQHSKDRGQVATN